MFLIKRQQTCTQTLLKTNSTSAKHCTPSPFPPHASLFRQPRFVRLFERQMFPIDHHSLSPLAHSAVASLLITFALPMPPKWFRLLPFLVPSKGIHFSPASLSIGLVNDLKRNKKMTTTGLTNSEQTKQLKLTCSWFLYSRLDRWADSRVHRRNVQIKS